MGTRDRIRTPLRRTPPQDPTSQALAAAFGAAALHGAAFSPVLLARVPLDRLQAIVDALKDRHGTVRSVRPYRELYQLRFSRGTELVWAQLDPEGRLTTLVTGPGALTARQSAEGVPPQSRIPATTPPAPEPALGGFPASGDAPTARDISGAAMPENTPDCSGAGGQPDTGSAALTRPAAHFSTAGAERAPNRSTVRAAGHPDTAGPEPIPGVSTVTGEAGSAETAGRPTPCGAVAVSVGDGEVPVSALAAFLAAIADRGSAVRTRIGPSGGLDTGLETVQVSDPDPVPDPAPERPGPRGASPFGGSSSSSAGATVLLRLATGYVAAAVVAAVLPFLPTTATGWLLLTGSIPALAWYTLVCGPTHALPPWFRALPLGAGALACLAGLRALPVFGPGLPWGVPGVPEMILFAAVLGLSAWTYRRSLPLQPSPTAHPLTLRSPLRDGCFAATEGGGPAVNRYAQESLTPGAGRSRRYAVDLVQLGDGPQWRGRRALGLSPAANERYAIFGHPVLSPVDGVVVAAVDGLPDHAPFAPTIDHPEGNHVAIDTGRALVVLSRLRHDSVRVRRGQHVTTGTPIGTVGNSGDGTEPGLHLRAETRTSHSTPGGGVGLPFRLAEVRGHLHRGRWFTLPD